MSIAPTRAETGALSIAPTGDGHYRLTIAARTVTLRREDLQTLAYAVRDTGSTRVRLSIGTSHATVAASIIDAALRGTGGAA
jgi:hypothetical protein